MVHNLRSFPLNSFKIVMNIFIFKVYENCDCIYVPATSYVIKVYVLFCSGRCVIASKSHTSARQVLV